MSRTWKLLAPIALACLACNPAWAVVLASDDFEAEGGGVGFVASDTWGNLAGGVSDTSVAAPAFRSFESAIYPATLGSGAVYIAFDFSTSQGPNWGGLAFFEGVDGGDETLFIGNPASNDFYGADLKNDVVLNSNVPVDTGVHRIIAQVEIGENDTYRIWVDNFNQAVPNNQVTIDGFVIDDPWLSARVHSDVPSGNTVTVDNLIISDNPADVGLLPSLDATLTINRDSGEITLQSAGGVSNIVGYSLRSLAGGFDQAGWNTIDGRDATDATPPGTGAVDNNDWQVLSPSGSTTELSEFTFDATLGDGLALTSTPLSLGSAWRLSPFEDVFAVVTVDDNGTEVPLAVQVIYEGAAALEGDLNGDGEVTLLDWAAFKSGQGVVNGDMTAVAAYRLGDLNGDYDHNLADFGLFADAYDMANGAGAFQLAVYAVPEPGALALVGLVAAFGVLRLRRRGALLAVALSAAALAPTAEAVIFAQDDFSSSESGTGWAVGDFWEGLEPVEGVVATRPTGSAPNVNSFRDFATPIDATNQVTYIRFDYKQGNGNGQNWGGFAFFEGLAGGGDEAFFAGNPGGGPNFYAFDLKQGGNLSSGVPFDLEYRTIIAEIDTTGADTSYKIWVDNYNINNPNAQVTIAGQGPIDALWQSLRFQSDGANSEFADNLLITDAAETALIFQAPPLITLNLLVDKSTGDVSLQNNTNAPVPLSAYSIGSASGVLSTGGTPGDFNLDGAVNAADYTVWRDNLGGDAAALNGNGAGGATVTDADYEMWKDSFGDAGGSGGGWDSLAGRTTPAAGFPQGAGNGLGWEEGANPSSLELEEYYLLGESTLAVGASISLGAAYAGGVTGAEDLVLEYRSGGAVVMGTVLFEAFGTVQAATVPEPTAAGLILIASASMLLAARRR